VTQIQEFRTGATRQNMETVHAKEEAKRLRSQLTELRDKLNDLEARVSWRPWNNLHTWPDPSAEFFFKFRLADKKNSADIRISRIFT